MEEKDFAKYQSLIGQVVVYDHPSIFGNITRRGKLIDLKYDRKGVILHAIIERQTDILFKTVQEAIPFDQIEVKRATERNTPVENDFTQNVFPNHHNGQPRPALSTPLQKVAMESDREDLSSSRSDSDEEPPTAPRRQEERTPTAGSTEEGTRTTTISTARRTTRLNPGAAKLPLKIRTLDGKQYNIQAHTDWTVKRLKEEFEEWRGEGSAQCVLSFRARRLADADLLSVYKMEPDSVIQANFRSTGGAARWLKLFVCSEFRNTNKIKN